MLLIVNGWVEGYSILMNQTVRITAFDHTEENVHGFFFQTNLNEFYVWSISINILYIYFAHALPLLTSLFTHCINWLNVCVCLFFGHHSREIFTCVLMRKIYVEYSIVLFEIFREWKIRIVSHSLFLSPSLSLILSFSPSFYTYLFLPFPCFGFYSTQFMMVSIRHCMRINCRNKWAFENAWTNHTIFNTNSQWVLATILFEVIESKGFSNMVNIYTFTDRIKK